MGRPSWWIAAAPPVTCDRWICGPFAPPSPKSDTRCADIVLVQLMRDGQDVFCGFDAEVSQFLVDQGVKLVGVDRGTPDCPHLKDKPAHVILLRNDVLIVEGLRNLDAVKGRRFTFLGQPLKIRGGTGSPIRAVAMIEKGE